MKADVLPFSSRCIWLVAVAVAVIMGGPVAFYVESTPWLLAVPIVIGVVVVVILEFASGSEIRISVPDMFSWFVCQLLGRKPKTVEKTLVNQTWWPKQPDFFIQPDPTLLEDLDSKIAKERKLVLTGNSGSGKTTCAVALCRRYEKLNGNSPVTQKPIFISLSQAKRSNGLSTMFIDRVSEHLASKSLNNPRSNAKKMLKSGSLLLVIDDLDYLGKRDQKELQEFIKRWKANAFLCLISEIPSNSPLFKDFAKIDMPGWTPEVVKSYISRRISDTRTREKLFDSLEQGKTLHRPLSPWQASFLVDACLEGRFYKLLSLGDVETKLDYKILDDYLRIVMENASPGITYGERIEEFGKLSLNLLKQGRSSFIPEKVQLKKEHLHGLISKLFQQQGESFAFVHGNYQVFLAGKYIAQFWSEAKTALRDDDAKALIWKPVYSCVRQFIPDNQVGELEEVFSKLGQ